MNGYINVGEDYLWMDATVQNNRGSSYDLTQFFGADWLADTKWVLRFSTNLHSSSAYSGGNCAVAYFVLSSLDSNDYWETQDYIGVVAIPYQGQTGIKNVLTNDDGMGSWGDTAMADMSGKDYWEITRDGDNFVWRRYSDSAYEDLSNVREMNKSGIENLRYLKTMNHFVAGSCSVQISIDDLLFYDAVSAVP